MTRQVGEQSVRFDKVATTNPTANDDFAAGYERGATWLNETTLKVFQSLDDSNGAAIWILIAPTTNRVGFSYNSNDQSLNDIIWLSLAHILWSGTAAYTATPTEIKGIIHRRSGNRSFNIRIYDVTNNMVIATAAGNYTQEVPTIISFGTISNVPAGEAVWEVQGIREGSGGACKVDLGAIEVRF